jgi:hypothetical protein
MLIRLVLFLHYYTNDRRYVEKRMQEEIQYLEKKIFSNNLFILEDFSITFSSVYIIGVA